MNRTEFHAIKVLEALGEAYGLDIVHGSGSIVPRGVVYTILHKFESKGLVESRQEEHTRPEIGIPRRLYRLTERGAFLLEMIGRDPALDS